MLRVVGVIRVVAIVTFNSKTSSHLRQDLAFAVLSATPWAGLPEHRTFPSRQLRMASTVGETNSCWVEAMACYYPSPLRESSKFMPLSFFIWCFSSPDFLFASISVPTFQLVEERLVSLLWLFLMRPVVSVVQN